MNTLNALKRSLWVGVILGALIAAATALPASSRPMQQKQVQTLTNVTFLEDFFDSDTHTGILAALDRGYWKAAGLDVTVVPGAGSSSTIQQVASGNATFGYADAFTMAQQVSKGADVTAIASTRQVFDGGVLYWPDSGISKPSDLTGKTYFGVTGGFIDLLLPLFAQNTGGWDSTTINYKALDGSTGQALFAAHQGDALTGSQAQLLLTPPVNGVAPKIFRFSDYGIDPLSFVIVSNSRQLKAHPGIAKAFLTGLLKGWTWACANPIQAVTLARHHYTTTLSLASGVERWQEVCSLEHTPDSKGQAIGWMALKDWQDTVKLLTDNPTLFGATPNGMSGATLFTNVFVNAVYPPKKQQNPTKTKK